MFCSFVLSVFPLITESQGLGWKEPKNLPLSQVVMDESHCAKIIKPTQFFVTKTKSLFTDWRILQETSTNTQFCSTSECRMFMSEV